MRCTWLIVLVVLLAVSVVVAQMGQEVPPVFTEDFETPDETGTLPKDWKHFSKVHTISLSTEQAHGGKYSLKLVDEDPVNAVGLRSPHIKVTPGKYVWVSWWYYGEAGNNQSMYIEFWTADGKRPQDASRSWGSAGKGKWIHQTKRAKVPANTATITLHANSYSTNVATGYFDDIEFGIGAKSMYDRTPQPAADVKHPCGLYKEADIERARRNIEKHAWAQATLASFKSASKFWMDCPDEQLSYWIPDITPFRVVDCPKCHAGWRFAWTGNDKQIKCRNCGFTWPDPDYPEDKVQAFPDPVGDEQKIPYYEGTPSTVYGSAKSPVYRLSGRLRYHRIGRLSSLGNLGKAYAFTGDIAYAEKVRKVLLRLADVYPHYLPHNWGTIFEDYSNLQSGKMSGWKLHDAGVFIQLATAYDLTYDSGVYSDDDKVKIEENCFREFTRLMTETSPRGCCINDGPTAMAAGALAGLMLGNHKAIAWAVEPPDGFLGFLEDYFYRDGHWYEASPSYEGMTLSRLYVTPEALRGYSDPPSYDKPDRYDHLDLFKRALMKKILVAGAPEIMPDGCLPATNDSTLGARYPRARTEQQYFWYPTEHNMRLMAWAFGGNIGETGGEYALFRREPDLDFSDIKPLQPSAKSIVRPDVGWAIMRTGDDRSDAALMIDYGPYGSGHGHPDRLNIIYYDFGKEMVTDLGYLGAGHPIHPWIRSTASHHHVIVDGKPQARAGGELEAFCGVDNVQGTIASAPAVYKDIVDTYRRYLLFVDHGIGRRYLVDLFEVKGGQEHQYGFHADGEVFEPPLFPYQDVDPGDLGDARTGYSWLKEVKRADAPLPFVAEWISDQETNLGTRLHMMAAEQTKLIYAKAPGLRNRSTPFAERDMYKVLVQRPGPENMFLSVIEAFKGNSDLQARELVVKTEAGQARAVEVKYQDAVDITIIADEEAAAGAITVPEYPALSFTGRMGFVSLQGETLQQMWMLGGERIAYGTVSLESTPRYEGKVLSLDQEDHTVAVDCDIPAGKSWAGQQMMVAGRSDGAYVIEQIVRDGEQTTIALAGEPIFTLKEGDSFAIVPAASMIMLTENTWHLQGEVAQLRLVDGKTLPDGRVMVPANSSSKRRQVYARVPGGQWQPLPYSADQGQITVRLSPEELDASEVWLYLATGPVDLRDAEAPVLTAISADDRELSVGDDLGYVASAARISLTFEDKSKLLGGSVKAVLVGQRAGVVPLSVHCRRLTGRDAGKWRITLRADGDRMAEDEYALCVQVGDVLANFAYHDLSFTTLGYVLPFESIPIVASSGKVSKPLGGLDTMFYRSQQPGDFLTYEFKPPIDGKCRLLLRYTRYSGYGIFQAYLDDEPIGEPVDMYFAGLDPRGGIADLGAHELSPGPHTLKLEITGKNPKAENQYIGVCELIFRPAE